jgi:peptide/nickel transport system ATP-binding protein
MEALLEVTDLQVELSDRFGSARILDGVSFAVEAGKVLGIVGESGAGKSMTGSAIIGLLPNRARVAGGQIVLNGRRIDDLSEAAMRKVRGRQIGAIFQDPLTSLNPLHTVGRQIVDTLRAHLPLSDAEAQERALYWLGQVGIPAAKERFALYPHQFSGGMRQRVVIALALCAEPTLVIADEPTTALDVSVQAQIIDLLRDLCARNGTAMMLITHDMGVIAELADAVAVMYAGRIAEIGPTQDILRSPSHPYTRGLMNAIPKIGAEVEELSQIDGAMPRPGALPHGCAFHPRCGDVMARCGRERPPLTPVGASRSACWLHEPSSPGGSS